MQDKREKNTLSSYTSPADEAMKTGNKTAKKAHQQPAKAGANEFMRQHDGHLKGMAKSAAEDASDINAAMNNAGYEQNSRRHNR